MKETFDDRVISFHHIHQIRHSYITHQRTKLTYFLLPLKHQLLYITYQQRQVFMLDGGLPSQQMDIVQPVNSISLKWQSFEYRIQNLKIHRQLFWYTIYRPINLYLQLYDSGSIIRKDANQLTLQCGTIRNLCIYYSKRERKVCDRNYID